MGRHVLLTAFPGPQRQTSRRIQKCFMNNYIQCLMRKEPCQHDDLEDYFGLTPMRSEKWTRNIPYFILPSISWWMLPIHGCHYSKVGFLDLEKLICPAPVNSFIPNKCPSCFQVPTRSTQTLMSTIKQSLGNQKDHRLLEVSIQHLLCLCKCTETQD